MYELIIVGGGPAGLAASVYAARKKIKTLLISDEIGGQMNWTLNIENYLGYQFIEGPELINKFQTQVNQFPIDQKIGSHVSRVEKSKDGFKIILETGDSYQAKTAIFATGKRPKRLNVPGEIEFTGRGVSYCAICDGPVFSGQKVAVIGGSNSALEAVLDMVKIASHVALVSLTPLTGYAILVDKVAQAKKLSVFIEHQTEKIEGDTFVKGIVIKNIKNNHSKRLDVTGVFVEIGLIPNSEAIKGLIKLKKGGEVPVNCACETTIPGLYAAGDVTNVPEKQIIIAAAEGAKAALQAHRYLQRLAI